MKIFIPFFIISVLCAGCAPSESTFQAGSDKVQTASPTITPTSTIVPEPQYKAGLPTTINDCNKLRGLDYLEEDFILINNRRKKDRNSPIL